MAVARTGATAANAGVGTTASLSINNPIGGTTPGNLIIINAGGNSGTAQLYNVPGFTAVPGFTPHSANSVCLQVLFYRICDGTEGATFSVNCSTSSQRIVATAACYSGVDTINPFCGISQTNDGATTGTTITFASTNSSSSPAYAVLLIRDRNATSVESISTPSAGYSVASESCTTLGSFNHAATLDEHSVYTGTPTFAVAPGNATITPNNSTKVNTVLLLREVQPVSTVKTLASMGVG